MSFVDEVKAAIAPERQRLFSSRLFKALLSDEKMPLDLWKIYLWESYHYVKYNGINQALCVLREDVGRKGLLRYYLKHAVQEIDHDLLCLNDLEHLGVDREEVIRSRPLPETAAFSSFLFDFVTRDNPVGRLGYSVWAEGTSEYAGLIVSRLRYHLELPDEAMSFVVEHADLDKGHAATCELAIERYANTDEDREAILYFGPATCHQFYYVLEAMYDRFEAEYAASSRS